MPAEEGALLADFARACRAAARAVSLYPPTHPAIQASLSRLELATARLITAGEVTLTVHPDVLLVEGRSLARPDPAVAELAGLLHERLVGELRVERAADAGDWLALLLLFTRTPEELVAGGGIAKAWAATGRGHFEIREIDYAEVLRDRGAGDGAAWDRIIELCLQGGHASLDERSLSTLAEMLDDGTRLGELLDRLQEPAAAGGAPVSARAAALLQLIRHLVAAATERNGRGDRDAVLQTVAAAASRLTPEILLELVTEARSADSERARVASAIVDRIDDPTIASFVARSVIASRGATERLAQAFHALVPELERKQQLLASAREEAAQGAAGREEGFGELWQSAADMLTSYSDEQYVSSAYARELSDARTQALEVERVADDPPDRVQAWLGTVDDGALQALDLALLLDLLRIEPDPAKWEHVAEVAAGEIGRRILLGDFEQARQLTEAIVRERGDEGRESLRGRAESTLDALARGPFVRHLLLQLRKADDKDVEPLNRLCYAIGPRVVSPLAEALAVEENNRAIRRLRELLLGFGAAGRQSVEQLKSSSNPAVRRTAIDLLRVFGGREALPELASMLDDADPQVQREAIRALIQMGTSEAYAVLERALVAGSAARETILQQLIGLRDDKAVPLLCHVLNHAAPRGRLVGVHTQIIDALGNLAAHPESTRTLRTYLHRGEWWAPVRTATLRRAAAAALRRIGAAETLAVLEEAARSPVRGVRSAAKAQIGAGIRQERPRS